MKVAGIGYRDGATQADFARVIALAGAQGVTHLATMRGKEAGLAGFAASLGLPLIGVNVAGVKTPTQSPRIMAMHGTGSVAEAAALIAAGRDARIIVPRVVAESTLATAAIAEGLGQ